MGRTTDLRRAVKATFVPFMREKGFAVDCAGLPMVLDFRRIDEDRTLVCDVQWEKTGRPRFILNFGSCGPRGVISHGGAIDPSRVSTADVPKWGRLSPGRGWTTGGWFRQDRPLWLRLAHRSQLRPAREVADELLALFPEVEAYWASGVVGSHLRVLPTRQWSRDR